MNRAFVIGIRRNESKLRSTLEHVHSAGIDAEPFYGLDYTTTGLDTIFPYEYDNPYTGYKISRKIVNLYLSHYTLWHVLLYQPDDSFLIMEDDVHFEHGGVPLMREAFFHLPDDWGMFYPGGCNCAQYVTRTIWDRLKQVSYILCTHCYAIRKKALPVLIETCVEVWTALDIAIQFQARSYLPTYALVPPVATQKGTHLTA